MAAVMLLGLIVGAAACGDDDGGTTAAPRATQPSSTGGEPASTDDEPTAAPTPMAPSASPTEGGMSVSLNTLGSALDTAIGDAILDYEVDGSMLRIMVNEEFDDFAMHCMIIEMTANSLTLPPDSQVQVVYTDGGVNDCDIQ